MPKDAHGPGIEAVTPKLAGELGLAGHPSQRGVGTEDPELPVGQAPSGSVRDHGIWASPATPAQQAPGWPYELSAASLLAAGVLAALGRKRREQLWRRAFGRRIAGPDPDAALAEKALRLGADDPAVRMLDTGLRYLCRQLGAAGRTPPTVFAAHLGQENLDLWVAPPDPNPPRPWQAADGGQVWRLPFAAMAGLDAAGYGGATGGPATMAPYPGLVSLGTNDSRPGPGGPGGGPRPDRGARPAPGGAGGAVRAGRRAGDEPVVRPDAGHAHRLRRRTGGDFSRTGHGLSAPSTRPCPTLEKARRRGAGAMASAGIDSVLTGRSLGPFPATDAAIWAPNYLIMGVPPTQAQAERLLALARSRYRMAVRLRDRGRHPRRDLDLGPVRRGAAARRRTGLRPGGATASAGAVRGGGQAVPRRRGRRRRAAGRAVAGRGRARRAPGRRRRPCRWRSGCSASLEVQAPGPLEPDRLALATELVVYLAAHPDGVHTERADRRGLAARGVQRGARRGPVPGARLAGHR